MGGQQMDFGEEVVALAKEASKAAQYEFTGVDILIDHQNRPYVLEVNPPSNFVALEHDLGLPVGDMIVTHLRTKASLLAGAA
jgi:glutathione synthase/RimK-type ligase-like ATP-grasp enzyme